MLWPETPPGKADGTQEVAVPRNGLPSPVQAVSGAASGFQKQGDVHTSIFRLFLQRTGPGFLVRG